MDKKHLREQSLALLKRLHNQNHQDFLDIHDNLKASLLWQEAFLIGITVAKSPEIPTIPLIESAWHAGKKICVPKCNPSDRSMKFYQIDDLSQLEPSKFGVLEPIVSITQPIDSGAIDLLVVPGLMFNHSGYRIGFGGGYYDRFLEKNALLTVSIIHSQQISDKIIIEDHDIPISSLFTESSVIDCNKMREQ